MALDKKIIRMKQALITASFSKSRRNKVGAILIKNKHIVCEGYNGTVSGTNPDILEYYFPKGESSNEVENVNIIETIKCPTCYGDGTLYPYIYAEPTTCSTCNGSGELDNTFHAEANLLLFCSKNGIPTNDGDLYITLSPCLNCAKLIVQAGIKSVYYKDKYRDDSGITFLKNHDITVEQIDVSF